MTRLELLQARLFTWLWDLVPIPCALCGRLGRESRMTPYTTSWGQTVSLCRACAQDLERPFTTWEDRA